MDKSMIQEHILGYHGERSEDLYKPLWRSDAGISRTSHSVMYWMPSNAVGTEMV
jgi:hypothetical protein